MVPNEQVNADALLTSLPTNLHNIDLYVGTTQAMQRVAVQIQRVAASSCDSVLIIGETGTGKELVARAIHVLGDRKRQTFFPVNCATIPATLAESQLFGAERGAFTNAQKHKGFIEMADRGTLFLDEIVELSPEVQRVLLRFLEDHRFRRLGGNRLLSADVRIVSATWRNIETAIAASEFREDLYYRINTIIIYLPALRERREDIPALFHSCLTQVAQRLEIATIPECSPEAMVLLQAHNWRGNIRELRNVAENILLFNNKSMITPGDLPSHIQRATSKPSAPAPVSPLELIAHMQLPTEPFDLRAATHLLEQIFIQQAMERTQSNQSKAAALLGYSRDELRQRLKRM